MLRFQPFRSVLTVAAVLTCGLGSSLQAGDFGRALVGRLREANRTQGIGGPAFMPNLQFPNSNAANTLGKALVRGILGSLTRGR